MVDSLLCENDSGVITLTLNRPEKLNAINGELESQLARKLSEIEEDVSAKVVVIRGAGRAFCAGADLSGDAELGVNRVQRWREAFLRSHRMLTRMLGFSKPIIAATHGYVLGMGFYLATACDMIISTDECKFGVPEIRHAQSSTGWVPVWNVRRNHLMELLLTGDLIDGKKAEAIGLVNRSVPSDRLEKEIRKLAGKLALIDPLVLSMNKAVINTWYNVSQYFEASLFSVESNAVINVSEPRKKWDEVFRTEGMKGFIKRRDEPFKKLDEE